MMMKLISSLTILLLLAGQGRGADWDKYNDTEIVEAIGRAENSIKFPYGIKSIPTNGDVEYARKICLNSVKNGRARWKKAGKPDDLIHFIGQRFCPPVAHKLNRNWERNVKGFLMKGGSQ